MEKKSRTRRIPPRRPIQIRPTCPYRDFTKPIPIHVDMSKNLKPKDLEHERTMWFKQIYVEALTMLRFESLGDLIKWMVDNMEKLEFEGNEG
ncbi:MAG: hypothetical protein QHH15_02010 [Candidatus Thermoplasmatota archaeon]|jgi:hypothetical protein|nr:hypothetical protein [Candidatus Thermoplasmatota archaeon]